MTTFWRAPFGAINCGMETWKPTDDSRRIARLDDRPVIKTSPIWWRVTRAGLLVLLGVAVLAWGGSNERAARKQRAAIASIEQAGGRVTERTASALPRAMLDLLGEDRFTTPSAVSFTGGSVDRAALEAAGRLESLREIDLSGEPVDVGSLAELVHLPALQSLQLRRTTLSSDAANVLAKFPALERLDLTGTRLFGNEYPTGDATATTPAQRLASLPNLKRLWVAETGLSGEDATILVQQRSIDFLDLTGNSITRADWASIASGHLPRTLILDRCGLTDEDARAISTLDNLEGRLSLRANRLTDAGLVSLGTLIKLNSLDLAENPVSPAAVETLCRQLDRCAVSTGP